jgi:hypothetical protein
MNWLMVQRVFFILGPDISFEAPVRVWLMTATSVQLLTFQKDWQNLLVPLVAKEFLKGHQSWFTLKWDVFLTWDMICDFSSRQVRRVRAAHIISHTNDTKVNDWIQDLPLCFSLLRRTHTFVLLQGGYYLRHVLIHQVSCSVSTCNHKQPSHLIMMLQIKLLTTAGLQKM